MFARATDSSISKPNAVGLIEMFASKPFSTIASSSLMYSPMKNWASSSDSTSSPRTSTVKQAPSELIRLIRSMALAMSVPATYLLATHLMMNRGVSGIMLTIARPNRPI